MRNQREKGDEIQEMLRKSQQAPGRKEPKSTILRLDTKKFCAKILQLRSSDRTESKHSNGDRRRGLSTEADSSAHPFG